MGYSVRQVVVVQSRPGSAKRSATCSLHFLLPTSVPPPFPYCKSSTSVSMARGPSVTLLSSSYQAFRAQARGHQVILFIPINPAVRHPNFVAQHF